MDFADEILTWDGSAVDDLRMPKKDGLQVMAELHARRLKPRVIVMSSHESEEDIRRALKAGTTSYLLKWTASQQFSDSGLRFSRGNNIHK
jgi:DNA-binding NarL/FixJ family response regulator